MEVKKAFDVNWLDLVPRLGIMAAVSLHNFERRLHRLSPRQAQFCHLWLKGYSIGEIADLCGVSEPNVSTTQKDGYLRLDCDNREDFMRRYGLLYAVVGERIDEMLEPLYLPDKPT